MQESGRRFLDRAELTALAGNRIEGLALAGLWCAGDLTALTLPAVAVVGTRAPSEDGRRLARALAAGLAAAGVGVLSGLALGIDAAAHEGALEARGRTIGVLGGGLDRFFPPRNAELARRIVAAGGLVLSPYPPDCPARPWQFLARNGIVAALACGVVVVEAAARSGALNTASWAADRGVPVMAFPGDVGRPKAAGCLALIRDGATLVRDAADVLAQLGIAAPAPAPATAERGSAADPLLALLAEGPATADALAAAGGLGPGAVLARLGELQATGSIAAGPDGRWRRSGG
jgi:DNA processing protein